MHREYNIPKLIQWFFRWYCKPEMYEEMHGDLEELYYERVEKLGPFRAKLFYFWDVIRCFQPYAWKRSFLSRNPSIVLFRNYYKTTFRSLAKNPFSYFINIFGLSAAIGICVFGYGFNQWADSIDQFHINKDEIFLTTIFMDRDGNVEQNGKTPIPLGEHLKNDFSLIQKVSRVEDRSAILKYDDKVFHERLRFVDGAFLEMLTFPLKWGVSRSLKDINSIILSEDMSVKYFGHENPIGEDILVKFSEERSKTFTITGVARDFPVAHDISFDFLINFENLKMADPGLDFNDWSQLIDATLILVPEPSEVDKVKQQMEQYQAWYNASQSEWKINSFGFEQLTTLYNRSENIHDDISGGSNTNRVSMIFIYAVSFFLLILACLNYVNIAIVSAAKRLKEIGLRKTIGATRPAVIIQFLAENVLITSFALALGLLFGTAVVIPWFEKINNFQMGFTLEDPRLWLYLPSVLLFTALVSGIYPALYISRFQVVGILKGSLKFGKKNLATKVFLGVQLMLTCIFIAIAIMFTVNHDYMIKRSWGYNQEETLFVRFDNPTAFTQLRSIVDQDPNVLSISGSGNHLGESLNRKFVDMPSRQYEVDHLSVGPRYFETMGIQLAAGQLFDPNADGGSFSVVVNETFVQNFEFADPIEKEFKVGDTKYEIIGVVKDFHFSHFDKEIRPLFFTATKPDEYQYLAIKVRPGEMDNTYRSLQAEWAILFPEVPFQGGYQEDVWGNYFNFVGVHGKVWRGLAIIAIVLAGLGLYGLVSLNVAGRVREFSIRRVLGARLRSVGKTILRQYIFLFAIALLIGVPVSYLLIEFILDFAYVYHMPMSPLGSVIGAALLLLVLFVVILTQLRGIGSSSPVQGLKVE